MRVAARNGIDARLAISDSHAYLNKKIIKYRAGGVVRLHFVVDDGALDSVLASCDVDRLSDGHGLALGGFRRGGGGGLHDRQTLAL